ncbi:hypothetical protein N0V88_004185 [Collariella sp. IMI 366227]|nr:hypothetical protein N0V88_004185 [Collariella sp. IMI 366227]
MLELPQQTLWVAAVFFHRFYMRFSLVEEKGGIHHYNIAATALFLANKTEENCRKTKELIIAVAKVAQKNTRLIVDEQSKEYWRWRDSILTYEELMLETLTFDLMVDNPYRAMYEVVQQLELAHNKALRDSMWAFCNDASLTILPLLLSARDVAIAAIFFATTITRDKIDDVDGQPWWQYLGASESNTIRAVHLMVDFYRENPLRKPENPKVPGSPEFNLESTRRRGELSLSQMGIDSPGTQYDTPTPLRASERETQSPMPPRTTAMRGVNGRAERDVSSSDTRDVVIKKEDPDSSCTKIGDEPPMPTIEVGSERGDSDAALKVAANEFSVHESNNKSRVNAALDGGLVSPKLNGGLVSPKLNGILGGGLVSPRIKRSSEPDESEERGAKRLKLEEDEDEGEIRG